MTAIGLYRHELRALRQELHNLKNCQVTFLTFSITATGVLLGLGGSLSQLLNLRIITLLPLIVLLPAWWIFFDKATTITRIVGYYRILERLILGSCQASQFLGWENALGEFRTRQEAKKLQLPEERQSKTILSSLLNILFLRTSQRYWVISYFTFLGLSGLCVAISIKRLLNEHLSGTLSFWTALVAAALVLISAVWNMYLIWQLIYGRHSYHCNEHFWRQILDVKEVS